MELQLNDFILQEETPDGISIRVHEDTDYMYLYTYNHSYVKIQKPLPQTMKLLCKGTSLIELLESRLKDLGNRVNLRKMGTVHSTTERNTILAVDLLAENYEVTVTMEDNLDYNLLVQSKYKTINLLGKYNTVDLIANEILYHGKSEYSEKIAGSLLENELCYLKEFLYKNYSESYLRKVADDEIEIQIESERMVFKIEYNGEQYTYNGYVLGKLYDYITKRMELLLHFPSESMITTDTFELSYKNIREQYKYGIFLFEAKGYLFGFLLSCDKSYIPFRVHKGYMTWKPKLYMKKLLSLLPKGYTIDSENERFVLKAKIFTFYIGMYDTLYKTENNDKLRVVEGTPYNGYDFIME